MSRDTLTTLLDELERAASEQAQHEVTEAYDERRSSAELERVQRARIALRDAFEAKVPIADDIRDELPEVCDKHRTGAERQEMYAVLRDQRAYANSERGLVISTALEDARANLHWLNRAELARFLDAVLLQRAWILASRAPTTEKPRDE